MTIREFQVSDAQDICEIYNYYIEHSSISFEEETLNKAEIINRALRIQKQFPWLVLEREDRVIGYAYASQWASRSAYRYSCESTIYLSPTNCIKGMGTLLYSELLRHLTQQGIHSVLAGITLPNDASIGLHKKLGFTQVSHLREIGFKFGEWRDVTHWQKTLNKKNS